MPDHKQNIPVNVMTDNFSQGISIGKISLEKPEFTHSHRDDGHTFHIIEKGTILIEIDFEKYEIKAPAAVYMHPNQVHRILDFDNITVCSLSAKDENLDPEYLKLLEEIAPSKPLELSEENHAIVADLFTICLLFSTQKNNRLHYPLLKDSCNTLIAFLISQFLRESKPEASLSRFEIITKSFRQLLEKNYCVLKRPADYADLLNITTAYLNECIRHSTGFSVSKNIQDRIILEAKRLLYHTNRSVKEIAFELGFIDYPYFTRFFAKATGMTALSFRNRNHD